MREKDEDKTRDQLLQELAALRQRNLALEEECLSHRSSNKSRVKSEALFEAITNVAEDSIFIKDTRFRYTFINPAMEKLLGVPAERLLGKTPAEIFGEKNAKIINEVDEPVLSGKIVNEVRDLPLGEEVLTFHTIQVPLRDDEGEIVGICGFVRDITDRIKAEKALQKSEELFRLASAVSSDLIYEWNVADDTIKWYGDIEAVLGYSPGEIPGTIAGWVKLIHRKDLARLKDAVEHHRTSTEPIRYEYRVMAAGGSWRYWIDRAIPVLDEKGRPVRWIGSCLDVTERNQAENDLLKAYKQLQEIDELKNNFLSNVSHELRTPLVGIKGYIDLLLRKSPDSQTAKEWLTITAHNVKRLESIINDLLDISMLHAKRVTFNFDSIDIIRQIERSIEALKPRWTEKQLDVRLHYEEDLPPVKADEDKIQSVILNLLDNAIKFTEAGKIIEIRVGRNNDTWARLEFIDEGRGIPEIYLEKIFTRFFQVDSSMTRKYNGSGIGLALVKEIVTAHGGEIEVESTPGKGTRFILTLPFFDENKRNNGELDNPESIEKTAPDKRRLNVMLVDDDPFVIDFLKSLLGEHCALQVAPNGKKSLEMINQDMPDLIFLDIAMPEMSGIEVCHRIKTNPKLKHLPVYMLTARIGEEDKQASLDAGANGFIEKPFPIEEVFDILKLHQNEVRDSAQ